MRLIDADALFVDASFFDDDIDRAERFYSEEQIKNAPTVDAVEVTRCKDCVFRYGATEEAVYCATVGAKMKLDDYCSYGEKKDETD